MEHRVQHKPRGPQPRKAPKTQEPIMLDLFKLIDADSRLLRELAEEAGVTETSLHYWRRGMLPKIDMIRALANVVGYEIALVPLTVERPVLAPARSPYRQPRKSPKAREPIVLDLFNVIDADGRLIKELAEEAHVTWTSLNMWRRGMLPRIDSLRALANVVGYDVALVPIDQIENFRIYKKGK